jgi:Cd2+/Zn2+-exporting ATPase
VDTIVFDKTGTLTTGRLSLEQVEVAGEWSADEALAAIAGAEHNSTHPLARSIVAAAEARRLSLADADGFRNYAGDGISSRVGETHLHVGRRRWLRDISQGRFPAIWEAVGHDDDHVRTYAWSERGSAMLAFRDEARPEAAATVRRLREEGFRLMILSGDADGPVRALARELGIEEWHARARPEDKVQFLKELVRQGRQVAMVGDGVNDAAALASARVGVVLGGLSSDAAAEEAGLVLVGGSLDGLLRAFELARRARRVMRANLGISIGAMVVLAVFAVAGALPLPVAVIGHEGSTVLVVLNSLRLLIGRRDSRAAAKAGAPRSHGVGAESMA